MLAFIAENQPHRALANLKGKLVRRLAHDAPSYSGVGASGIPGAVHYHRIANAEVAAILEGLAQLSPTDHVSRPGRIGRDTRQARSCYNHIAGRLGVLLAERLIALNVLMARDDAICAGPRYHAFLDKLGIEDPPGGQGKSPAKFCLDWTERRHHISGPLATAIMQKFLEARWLERRTGSRALNITAEGLDVLASQFGLTAVDMDRAWPV